ncbi:MAG TPA: hypothetical protein VGW58_04860 [Pyrinomonadaceae bacterium]|nr:hypothetical protein [Pyrinomonadaceae bacterium]
MSLTFNVNVRSCKSNINVKWVLVLLGTSLTLFLSCHKSQTTTPEIESWTVAAADPVSAVGHGAIWDAQGKEISPSPQFVIDAQRFYLRELYKQADEKTRAELNGKVQRLKELKSLAPHDQIFANSALIAWLIDVVKPEDAAHLASKNGALRNRSFLSGNVKTIHADVLGFLDREGVITYLSPTTLGGTDYINECRDAGVPIPPDWGDSRWVEPTGRRLQLNTEFIDQSKDAVVHVYRSQDPDGICLALPRSVGDQIDALGIICLGRQSSKACFWDNINRTPDPDPSNPDIYRRFRISFPVRIGESVPLSRFGGGADLFGGVGVCSDCHAGQNPFVVHPGDRMDFREELTATAWYEPLVDPRWPQNPGPTTVLEDLNPSSTNTLCLECHGRTPLTGQPLRRFPEVSRELREYCSVVLPSAYRRTMPPSRPGNPAFASHFNELTRACTEPSRTPVRVVINGATRSRPGANRINRTDVLGACTGGDCPIGFCYWRTVHGPFWQQTPSTVPVESPDFRGSSLRIFAEGVWKSTVVSVVDEGTTNYPPGGTVECFIYRNISGVPDPNNCFANFFAITDPDGTRLSDSVDVGAAGSTVDVFSGYIGNVAQAAFAIEQRPDTLRIMLQGDRIVLSQNHTNRPPAPFRLGFLSGEAWTNGCNAWTPRYLARDVFTESDVGLVAYPDSRKVFCFITGVSGAWSSTRSGGALQPFAEIYTGRDDDIRLRVFPSGGVDGVGAYASCIQYR